MTHPAYLRDKARALRIERRMTIDELAERLALPRTTIYHWVRDLPIPRSGGISTWPESGRRKGNLAMQAKYRKLREDAYERGVEEWPALLEHPTFRDFVCLYVAEGYKRSRNTVSLANSDPAVIVVADGWIRRLSTCARFYRVQYHADQDLGELRRFWGELLAIDPTSVLLQRKSNSNQLTGRTWRSVHGVLTVGVNDTATRARLQAWMDLIRRSWG